MSWVPYTGTSALARAAARTMLMRVVLGVSLVALVLATAAAARHPQLDKQPLLPSKAGGVIVLDLSASISSDTYSRIGSQLTDLAERGGHYGLVIFSTTAYQALPPGTPASALKPIARYFTQPKQNTIGAQSTFPVNPWTKSFTGTTQISQGLALARRILQENGARKPTVFLISDLADDQSDIVRLGSEVAAYNREGVRLIPISLNATAADEQQIKRMIGTAAKVIHAKLPSEQASVGEAPHARFPIWIVIFAVGVAVLLAANEVRSARLRWGGAGEATTA